MNEREDPDTSRSEARLRDRFITLRREEERIVPEFTALWRGKRRGPGRRWRWVVATACILIVVLALVWQRPARHYPPETTVASVTDWKSPTDFLLETPGRELLRTVPEFGEWRAKKDAALPAPPSVKK
ncbi:MAG TPA: hypothetical protein VH724_02195 [Candidatus Angelobacter sp.]|jgi:hypothetical protein|nr:hypothetical protein [Candidatus Angelobacter sp.]